jgi:MFS transporter, DHA2 family, multidrug resistance protein
VDRVHLTRRGTLVGKHSVEALDDGGGAGVRILGALLTAGYVSAVASAIASAPAATRSKITDAVAAQLQRSFAGADAVAERYPRYADRIVAAAKSSFIDGADRAYTAGIIDRAGSRAGIHALPSPRSGGPAAEALP